MVNQYKKTLLASKKRAQRNLKWFAIATGAGLLLTLAVKLFTSFPLPWWEIAVLGWGLVFLPWSVYNIRRKEKDSWLDVYKAKKKK